MRLIILLSMFAIGCKKQTSDPAQTTLLHDNPLQIRLDSQVHDYFKPYMLKASSAGVSMAVINGNQTRYYHYGETKKGNRKLPDNETLFEIGSLTKTFSSALLVKWCNQHSINLNSSIKSYLPAEVRNHLSLNNVDVTFKQLLNHTSGMQQLPNGFPNTSDPYSSLDSNYIYQYISNNIVLTKTPGTQPISEQEAYDSYSNMAYALVGLILERNVGMSLEQILHNEILVNLGMLSTTFAEIESKENRAYPNNIFGSASYWHLSGFKSAGGLKSNVNDLVKYTRSQMDATSSSELGSTFLETQNPTVIVNGKNIFALGWELYYTSTGRMLVVKDGGTGGFTSYLIFDRLSDKALIALFNNASDNNTSYPVLQLAEKIFD